MDLNKLLCEHQVALHDLGAGSSLDERRWAGLRAAFYAEEIRKTRDGLGRSAAFTWSGQDAGAPEQVGEFRYSKLEDAITYARRVSK